MYEVVYRKQAAKALRKMPKPLMQRFVNAFHTLAQGQRRGLDISRLTGREGYRLRIGDWRALYRIEEARLIIEVLRIGPRGDVYK